jgi:nucleoside-diphosphate-sugar epimerase
MQKTVLILGATGRFGAAAARGFAQQGWHVIAQTRNTNAKPIQGASPNITWLSADPADTTTITQAALGVSVVVHAWNPPYTAWQSQLLLLTEQAMAIAQALNAHLLVPGNVYNYGSALPELLTESTPQGADTVKGNLRIQMEQRLQARCDLGLKVVVLRAGDFFGAGKGNWFDLAITKDFAKGRVVYPGSLNVTHAWAYLPDLAHTAVQLMECVLAQPQQFQAFEVFHYGGHSFTGQDLLDALTHLAGKPLKLGTMPWSVIRAGAWFVPMWRELAEMRYLWTQPHQLDGSKLKTRLTSLRLTPHQTPLRAALSQALMQPTS